MAEASYEGPTVDLADFDPATFNPHDPAFLKNPYPFYEWFRRHAPVSWVDGVYKSYWVFRYEDVVRVLTGTDLWIKNDPVPSGEPPPGFDVLANMPNGVFTLDNPRHDQVRRELDPLFAKAIEGVAAAAAPIAEELLAEAASAQRFELIEAFALPLPARALCHVLGVPKHDWPVIMEWVKAILLANDPTRGPAILGAGGTTSMALRAYYHALVPGPVISPTKDGMIHLMATAGEHSAARLSADEVTANAVTMSIAGYYSTTFLIGTGVLNLLKNPGSLEELRDTADDPEVMQKALWEMLRYDGPVQLIDRYAAEETELGGVRMPKGQKVTVVVGSANWDETVFAKPASFDISRNAEKMLSFGDGIHRCLGEPLFKLVAPVAFKALLNLRPAFRLAGQPQWQTDPYLRAVSNLPLALS